MTLILGSFIYAVGGIVTAIIWTRHENIEPGTADATTIPIVAFLWPIIAVSALLIHVVTHIAGRTRT